VSCPLSIYSSGEPVQLYQRDAERSSIGPPKYALHWHAELLYGDNFFKPNGETTVLVPYTDNDFSTDVYYLGKFIREHFSQVRTTLSRVQLGRPLKIILCRTISDLAS
jgi:hypothetical protein